MKMTQSPVLAQDNMWLICYLNLKGAGLLTAVV